LGGNAIVLDIGKTMSKASLWSPKGELLARCTRANLPSAGPGYPALDATGIEAWLAEALAELARLAPVSSIIPVAHGAGFAVLRDGALLLPPMDYELELSPSEMASYGGQRDSFALTGSPALPAGLNLGAQLHALQSRHPTAISSADTLLPWAQYWAWRLCGVATSERTSLGCHTDLWYPAADTFSLLAEARGWAARFAPLHQAGECLGPLLPEWTAKTGLPATIRVHCGLHDSNAALLAVRAHPEIGDLESTVLSTGTWFVALRTPAGPIEPAALPEARDCLVNVEAFGRTVPSARFMGGREAELLLGDDERLDVPADQPALLAAVPAVLAAGAVPLPSRVAGCGPYPHGEGGWPARPLDGVARRAAIGLYIALMVDSMLELIGSSERLVVEGRFAACEVILRALASLRPEQVVYRAPAENDVSYGALRLLQPELKPAAPLQRVAALEPEWVTALTKARTVWRKAAEVGENIA